MGGVSSEEAAEGLEGRRASIQGTASSGVRAAEGQRCQCSRSQKQGFQINGTAQVGDFDDIIFIPLPSHRRFARFRRFSGCYQACRATPPGGYVAAWPRGWLLLRLSSLMNAPPVACSRLFGNSSAGPWPYWPRRSRLVTAARLYEQSREPAR